jgi:hypothetical protein
MRAPPHLLTRVLAGLGFLLGALSGPCAYAQVAGEGATQLIRFYGERAAHIQMLGELPDAVPRLIAQGSGFLLDDRHILTANHILPDTGDDYKTTYINVRLNSREADPARATVVARDTTNDFALLALAKPADPARYCPVSAMLPPAQLDAGAVLLIMSFPLDEERESNFGALSRYDSGGRIKTRLPLYPGDSGAPVFSSKGYLVAIVTGALTKHMAQDGTVTFVDSIGYLMSLSQLAASPVGTYLAAHALPACWHQVTAFPGEKDYAWTPLPAGDAAVPRGEAVSPTVTPTSELASVLGGQENAGVNANALFSGSTTGGSEGSLLGALSGSLSHNLAMIAAPAAVPKPPVTTVVPTASALPPLPETMRVSHEVEIAKEVGPTSSTEIFTRTFPAEDGYRVEECGLRILGESHSDDVACTVAPDRKTAILRFRLTSDPSQEPSRGWLQARLTLAQRRADLTDGAPDLTLTSRIPIRVVFEKHELTMSRKDYDLPYPADAGKRIVECGFESVSSANNGRVACVVAPGGSRAHLRFQLRSGPFFDRWRGWIDGKIRLVQTSTTAGGISGSP